MELEVKQIFSKQFQDEIKDTPGLDEIHKQRYINYKNQLVNRFYQDAVTIEKLVSEMAIRFYIETQLAQESGETIRFQEEDKVIHDYLTNFFTFYYLLLIRQFTLFHSISLPRSPLPVSILQTIGKYELTVIERHSSFKQFFFETINAVEEVFYDRDKVKEKEFIELITQSEKEALLNQLFEKLYQSVRARKSIITSTLENYCKDCKDLLKQIEPEIHKLSLQPDKITRAKLTKLFEKLPKRENIEQEVSELFEQLTRYSNMRRRSLIFNEEEYRRRRAVSLPFRQLQLVQNTRKIPLPFQKEPGARESKTKLLQQVHELNKERTRKKLPRLPVNYFKRVHNYRDTSVLFELMFQQKSYTQVKKEAFLKESGLGFKKLEDEFFGLKQVKSKREWNSLNESEQMEKAVNYIKNILSKRNNLTTDQIQQCIDRISKDSEVLKLSACYAPNYDKVTVVYGLEPNARGDYRFYPAEFPVGPNKKFVVVSSKEKEELSNVLEVALDTSNYLEDVIQYITEVLKSTQRFYPTVLSHRTRKIGQVKKKVVKKKRKPKEKKEDLFGEETEGETVMSSWLLQRHIIHISKEFYEYKRVFVLRNIEHLLYTVGQLYKLYQVPNDDRYTDDQLYDLVKSSILYRDPTSYEKKLIKAFSDQFNKNYKIARLIDFGVGHQDQIVDESLRLEKVSAEPEKDLNQAMTKITIVNFDEFANEVEKFITDYSLNHGILPDRNLILYTMKQKDYNLLQYHYNHIDTLLQNLGYSESIQETCSQTLILQEEEIALEVQQLEVSFNDFIKQPEYLQEFRRLFDIAWSEINSPGIVKEGSKKRKRSIDEERILKVFDEDKFIEQLRQKFDRRFHKVPIIYIINTWLLKGVNHSLESTLQIMEEQTKNKDWISKIYRFESVPVEAEPSEDVVKVKRCKKTINI